MKQAKGNHMLKNGLFTYEICKFFKNFYRILKAHDLFYVPEKNPHKKCLFLEISRGFSILWVHWTHVQIRSLKFYTTDEG